MAKTDDKREKRPTGFRVDDATMRQITALMAMDGSRSFQQFCERALQCYMGYLVTQEQDSYLSRSITGTLRGLFAQFESDVHRDLNKLSIAVTELMLTQVLTAQFTREELDRIRGRAVELVKKYGGPPPLGRAQTEAIELLAGGDDTFQDS